MPAFDIGLPRRFARCSLILAMAACLFLSVWAVNPPPAEAQAETIRQLNEIMIRAQEAYDNLYIERATELCQEGVDLIQLNEIEDPIAAQIYLMLGILEISVSSDSDVTRAYFIAGLEIDYWAELDPFYVTPILEDLFEEAHALVPEPVIEPEYEPILQHTAVLTAEAGTQIDVAVNILDPMADVDRLVLSYRPPGQDRFVDSNMQQQSSLRFVGSIPGEATENGTQLQYFIEARSRLGDLVDAVGSSSEPYTVNLLASTRPSSGREDHTIVAAVAIGSGGGLATGEPEVQGANVDLNPGIAFTPLHFYLDVGYRFGDGFSFGPFARLQTVLLTDGVELEAIVGGKLKWFFDEVANPSLYASFGGGYGYVRHTVDLAPTIDFVDTTREGPGHIGVGFGFVQFFSDNVGLMVDIYTMVLFDQVSVQLDLNAGLFLSF